MTSTLARAGQAVVTLLLAGWGTWGGLFLWYRLPGPEWVRAAGAGVLGLAVAAAVVALWRQDWRPTAALALLLAGLVAWDLLLVPRNDRDWADDVARPLTATITGERVVVHDVRDFTWRSDEDFTPRWEERTYDLADLATVDLINSYWTGPLIAHTLLAFGFRGGRYLTFSIEIRREKSEEYSALAGFFRQYELVVVAADERDIVRVRANVRDEDVQLYRLKATQDQARRLFLGLLGRANTLAAHPAFYNSLTTNCTTELFGVARDVVPGLPVSWRIILSGYLPGYAYAQALLETRLPFDDLRRRSHVGPLARKADDDPAFSARIREGLPDPNR